MGSQTLRVGIVGAGSNTRLRHIPGLRAISGVEIVGVVNRSPESSARAACELAIAKAYPSWQELVQDPDIDAIVIGTWPNMHCEITCAALQHHKHVLTEARMARHAAEAVKMLEAAQSHPELVAQIVPSPFGLVEHDFIKGLIADGFLGELREFIALGANDQFWDVTQPIHWRQDREISGYNLLAMGILHESASRWVPRTNRVFAQTAIFGPTRPTPDGGVANVTVPDSAQVVTTLENGGRGLYHLSGSILFGPGLQIHLYGSLGTIKVEFTPRGKVLIGKPGEKNLSEANIPANLLGGWRVEAEFVGAIRGEESVRFTRFEDGVEYMKFTEAVGRSAELKLPVEIGLSLP